MFNLKTSNNILIWKKLLDVVPNVLIPNAKILTKKACDTTLENPNRSFVAFSDNILTLFIRTFKTPSQFYAKSLIQIELNTNLQLTSN